MKVQLAELADIASWLALAEEVEPLFGPMVHDPKFQASLRRTIQRGSAFCVRNDDGAPGTPILAGLLFSAKPPTYTIGWMAVSRQHRRHGLGQLLLTHVTQLVEPPAVMELTTFGEDVVDGQAARAFYAKAGFVPAEMTGCGPEGGTRQVFRKTVS